jgi:uncharacterized Tic20 family protein
MKTNILPTQDERIIAGIAHIALIAPFADILAALLIWLTQRGKSPYVHFQALQALMFQLLKMACLFVGMFIYMVVFLLMFILMFIAGGIGSVSENGQGTSLVGLLFLIPFFLAFFTIILTGIVQFAFLIYGVVGGVLTFTGKDFRYIWLGNWIYRKLIPNPNATIDSESI